VIVLKRSMRAVHQRNALAHGIAHAVLGHRDDRPKHERQADRYAARHLIDPVELRAVQAWTQDPGQIAAELGVTRRLLLAYSG
jgi:Zn-dependent peptidase ImmA (M78 family)